MKKILVSLLLGLSLIVNAQQLPGGLKGKVTDEITRESVPFAGVTVKLGDERVASGVTDFDGNYNIAPLDPGTYNVEVASMGYATKTLQGVLISANNTKVLNITVSTEKQELEVIELVDQKLIEPGKTNDVKTAEQITNLPIRDVSGIAALTPGVQVGDDGAIRFRGARAGTNQIFIDGVKVRGDANLPREAIAQQEVITGGLPANYGDVTGGVISTTTKNPLPYFFGGAELVTSSPFDAMGNRGYHYNLAGLTIGGPIWKKNMTDAMGNPYQKTVIGFLFAGEFQYDNDSRPTIDPLNYLNDADRADLEKNPIRASNVGLGTLSNAEFITQDQIEQRWVRENSGRIQTRLSGNVKIVTGERSTFTIGGRYNYNKRNLYSYNNSMFNYAANREAIDQDWSVFGRFQQSFKSSDSSLFKNVFYTIQVDYTRNNDIRQDAVYKDDIFRYGHIGKFETQQSRIYSYGTDTTTGLTGWIHSVTADTAVQFTPNSGNIRANYTSQYYDFVRNGSIFSTTTSLTAIQLGGGLINGDNPNSVYSLWANVGTLQGGYNEAQNSQFRLTANSTFNIKDHSLIVGIEFEQRTDRAFNVSGNGLWQRMRLLQNDAIRELDIANPIPVYDANGVFQDTVNYNRAFDASKPRTFDYNLREKMGLDPNGTDWLDIDSYDPSLYSLDLFSASELINIGGSQYVSYYGYDYTGKIASGNPTLKDFYQDPARRQIAAFQPIYMAGYLQDQFTFNDLFFNIGVRVDRFDANQSVLADPFVLYPTYKVGDLGSTPLADAEVPAGMGSDYVVYVDDMQNPKNIVGYRSGSTWYDANGDIETNPKNIADASGGIKPYLRDPNKQELAQTVDQSFIDYKPQVTVSPRIAFQFPITDEAEFFAHYDLLVRRPDPGLNRMDPITYLQLENGNAPGFISNPDLKPQKTTDYEIGFRQMLSRNSALKISAFYREMRDMMQTVALNQAYPVTYVTYGNQDFGTVKGFTFQYDLRRNPESNITLTANYTLQFADGSGSGPNSGANLANSGQPNLRYILPLDYDNRHVIVLNMDWRYSGGRAYNGPQGKVARGILENAGLNLLLNLNSGTPYTRRNRAFALTEGASSIPLTGQINGSRLPWQTKLDLNINKVWYIQPKAKEGKQARKRPYNVEVYFTVLNILNNRNVTNVYAYTGSPVDDGYLVSPQGQNALNFQTDAQSYTDLYNASMVNPFNFGLPRQYRLGLRFGF
ncbi:MAG: carboxypeptidase regulatory-like domain-containing protein [Schleiferiaceae bacterium]|nr:carboxypeptidase regulatory-like domain-containing protein [Schleiferiaceae bacterium]